MAERSEMNLIKRVGSVVSEAWLLVRLAFDPTTDPIYVEYKRQKKDENSGLIKPQTFATRLKNAIIKGGL